MGKGWKKSFVMKNTLTWLPRILAFLYAGFLAIFALDAFSGDISLSKQILGFLIHLVPALSVLLFLAVAWKYRLAGGLGFLVLGMIFTVYFGTYRLTANFVMISLPLFLTGVLFMVSHRVEAGNG